MVRVVTAGEIRRISLEPLLDLVDPLLDEWDGLEFDEDGNVVNPLSGLARPGFRLIEGKHGHKSTCYRIELDPLPDGATTAGGRHSTVMFLSLRRDDRRHLDVMLSAQSGLWRAEIDIDRRRRVFAARVTADLTTWILSSTLPRPGCWSPLFGGRGRARGSLDLRALEGDGGELLDVEGRSRHFRGSSDVTVKASKSVWAVAGGVSFGGRWLGRLLIVPFSWKLRRKLRGWLSGGWSGMDHRIDQLERFLTDLEAAVKEAGGPQQFVCLSIWDDTFEPPGLPRL